MSQPPKAAAAVKTETAINPMTDPRTDPTTDPSPERPAVTTAQAAEVLGVSAQTVQKWVDAGHLPAWRTMGGHRRLDALAVEQMVQERKRQQGRLPGQAGNGASANAGGSTNTSTNTNTNTNTNPTPAPVLDVVLVEDNPLTLEVLSERLKRLLPGLQVRACADAITALLEVGRVVPDLLVADINLPGVDGLAMLAQLRHNVQTRDMQVLLVTHHSPEEVRQNFGQPPAGVPLLQKPVSDVQLAAELGGVLQHKHRQAAAKRA
jgi:excisionase family DNA binding protein